MSIMMDRLVNPNNGFFRGPSILSSPGERENGLVSDLCNSSSSSSIGINSDDDDEEEEEEEEEVESKLNDGLSFDSVVEDLEQALPIRRGISNFYAGKSKSFASLSDTTRSSIKDITKSEDAYSRKRKRILAYNIHYENTRTTILKSPGIIGGISKKSTNSTSRNTLALAVAMKNCEDSGVDARIQLAFPPSPWRSYSLVDLKQCGVSVKSNLCSPLIGKRSKS